MRGPVLLHFRLLELQSSVCEIRRLRVTLTLTNHFRMLVVSQLVRLMAMATQWK